MRLSNRFLEQGCVKQRVKSYQKKLYCRYGDRYNNRKFPSFECCITLYVVTPCIDQTLQQLMTLLSNWTILLDLTFTQLRTVLMERYGMQS